MLKDYVYGPKNSYGNRDLNHQGHGNSQGWNEEKKETEMDEEDEQKMFQLTQSIQLALINIIQYLYVNKFLKENSQAIYKFRGGLQDTINTPQEEIKPVKSEISISQRAEQNQKKLFNNVQCNLNQSRLVSCVLEQDSSQQLIYDLVMTLDFQSDNIQQFLHSISELIYSFVQSPHTQFTSLIRFILPSISKILMISVKLDPNNGGIDLQQYEQNMLKFQQMNTASHKGHQASYSSYKYGKKYCITLQSISRLVDGIVRVMKSQELLVAICEQYDLAAILLNFVNILINEQQVLIKEGEVLSNSIIQNKQTGNFLNFGNGAQSNTAQQDLPQSSQQDQQLDEEAMNRGDQNEINKNFNMEKTAINQQLLNRQNQQQALLNQVMNNMDIIVKLMYYSPIKLNKSSESFIKTLLLRQSSEQYNKLGLYALYCISLALQEKNFTQNLVIFADDQILRSLFKFFNEKDMKIRQLIESQEALKQQQINKNTSQNTKQFTVKAQVAANSLNECIKLKQISQQIIVVVLEYTNKNLQTGNISLNMKPTSETSEEFQSRLTNKIFTDYDFLHICIKLCLKANLQSSPSSSENYYRSSLDEIKLCARALASMPGNLIKKMNVRLNVHEKDLENGVSMMSYFKCIQEVLKVNDDQSNYFILFSLLNFINSLELKAKEIQLKSAKDLSDYHLFDLDYATLIGCLIKSNLLNQILLLPQITSDEDTIRICMKLLITIMFKGQTQKILFITNSEDELMQYEGIWNKLGIQVDQAKETSREQLKVLIRKLHSFELTKIHESGYIHFLHLVSQIIIQTNMPLKSKDEKDGEYRKQLEQKDRSNLLPPSTVLADIINQMSKQINDQEIQAILEGSDQSSQRILLYKVFFFNYLLSVTIPDLIREAYSSKIASINEQKMLMSSNKSYKDLDANNQPYENILGSQELSDLPEKLLVVLEIMLNAFKNKAINSHLDYVALNKVYQFNDRQKKTMQDPSGNGQSSQRETGGNFEESKSPYKGQPEDEQASTTMSLIKIILFNIECLIKCSNLYIEGHNLQGRSQLPVLTVSEGLQNIIVSILLNNIDNGDIVESSYNIFDKFLTMAGGSSSHQNVKVLESSKELLSLSIKHSAIYQCSEAYVFLKNLVLVSEKYKNKSEINSALSKITPVQIKSRGM